MVDFGETKKQFPIEKVAELLNLDITKQRNGQYRGQCPIHGGTDPRGFVITPSKGLWYCFGGCGGGDQLALIAKIRKCAPKEAAEWLVGDVGGTSRGTVPSKETVAESDSGMAPLDYLEVDHDAVAAVGFDTEVAEAVGIGFAPRGMMKGTVAIPVRLPTGELIGYVGLTDIAIMPPKWHLPDPKIVRLRPQKAS